MRSRLAEIGVYSEAVEFVLMDTSPAAVISWSAVEEGTFRL
ncbi:hypothetical protein ACFLU6_02970 [Acidobacteriota bacterium]